MFQVTLMHLTQYLYVYTVLLDQPELYFSAIHILVGIFIIFMSVPQVYIFCLMILAPLLLGCMIQFWVNFWILEAKMKFAMRTADIFGFEMRNAHVLRLQDFRNLQVLTISFNHYYGKLFFAYSFPMVSSFLTMSLFGLIRYDGIDLVSFFFLLVIAIFTNLIIFFECCIVDVEKPCKSMIRQYKLILHKDKVEFKIVRSFCPLKLKVINNFAYPRKYLYLAVIFRLSRILATMLISTE